MCPHSRRAFIQLLRNPMDHENSKENLDEQDSYSQRRFRRYHRAQAKRRAAEKGDARFTRVIISITGIVGVVAVGLAVFGARGATMDMDRADYLTRPWIGEMTRIEGYGLGVILLIVLFFYLRRRWRG